MAGRARRQDARQGRLAGVSFAQSNGIKDNARPSRARCNPAFVRGGLCRTDITPRADSSESQTGTGIKTGRSGLILRQGKRAETRANKCRPIRKHGKDPNSSPATGLTNPCHSDRTDLEGYVEIQGRPSKAPHRARPICCKSTATYGNSNTARVPQDHVLQMPKRRIRTDCDPSN